MIKIKMFKTREDSIKIGMIKDKAFARPTTKVYYKNSKLIINLANW